MVALPGRSRLPSRVALPSLKSVCLSVSYHPSSNVIQSNVWSQRLLPLPCSKDAADLLYSQSGPGFQGASLCLKATKATLCLLLVHFSEPLPSRGGRPGYELGKPSPAREHLPSLPASCA